MLILISAILNFVKSNHGKSKQYYQYVTCDGSASVACYLIEYGRECVVLFVNKTAVAVVTVAVVTCSRLSVQDNKFTQEITSVVQEWSDLWKQCYTVRAGIVRESNISVTVRHSRLPNRRPLITCEYS